MAICSRSAAGAGRAAIVLLSLAGVLAGCGTSSPRPSRVTRGQLTAYAREVNLQISDVTGAIAESGEKELSPAGEEDALIRCTALAAGGADVTFIHSPRLFDRYYEALSLVGADLQASSSAAHLTQGGARELAARGSACEKQVTERERLQMRLARIEVSTLSDPLSGVDGSVGFRLRVVEVGSAFTMRKGRRPGAPVTLPPATAVRYEDVLLLAVGRALVALQVGGPAGRFPLAGERALLSLLHSRAEAHRL